MTGCCCCSFVALELLLLLCRSPPPTVAVGGGAAAVVPVAVVRRVVALRQSWRSFNAVEALSLPYLQSELEEWHDEYGGTVPGTSRCAASERGGGFRVRWADDQADRAAGSPAEANGPLKNETVVLDSKRNIISCVRMPRYSRELLRNTSTTRVCCHSSVSRRDRRQRGMRRSAE